MPELKAFREWLDEQLQAFVDERFEQFASLHQIEDIALYSEHLKQILSGGKRIRPYFCALGLRCAGVEDWKQYADVFVGLELFHVFCLVHDDIIDQSALRRGKMSLHKHIEASLKGSSDRGGRLAHVSEGQAMLLGDLLFAWAVEVLYSKEARLASEEVAQMIREVVAGQMIDVQTTLLDDLPLDVIERKNLYKTASYTFVRPFRIGMALGAVANDEIASISTFANPLGIGFQIQDDYLDLVGDSEKTGKPTLADVREGQHTVFSHAILTQGSPELVLAFKSVFGVPTADEQSLKELQGLLIDSGLLEEGVSAFNARFEEAKSLVRASGMPEQCREELMQFIDILEKRVA